MKQEISIEEKWRMLVIEGKGPIERERAASFYSLLPSQDRCRICKVPFAGLSGRIMRTLGKTHSNINPHLCSNCDTFFRMNPGGVEVRLSMLFADIRGSTGLAEQMPTTEFHRLVDRFFAASTGVLCNNNAIIDKLAGDQVSAYFVPGLAGPDHARVALHAAQELLLATGHGEPGGPWIPLGIGLHTGEAFIGSVGTQGGIYDLTALGDAVNVAARLASTAGPGELLVSQETIAASGLKLDTNTSFRELTLKGRTQPVTVYTL
jgi:adenylate cyclase